MSYATYDSNHEFVLSGFTYYEWRLNVVLRTT